MEGQLVAEDVRVVRQGRTIVGPVSIAATPGRVLALVGPNGAGKSTLLGALSGRIRPDVGRVTLAGTSLGAWEPRALARRRAMLSQRVDLTFGFSAHEVVLLGRSPHVRNPGRDDAIAAAALRAVHAWDLRHHRYTALSGGEQQRVQLARVLAQVWDGGRDGAWLLLDEPEAGLDIAHEHFILQRARACAARGLGVIAVLHDLNLAARYADEVAVLAGGVLRRLGPPQEALETSLLSQIYGIPLARSVGIDAA